MNVWIAGGAPSQALPPQALLPAVCSMGEDRFVADVLDCLRASIDVSHFSVLRVDGDGPTFVAAGTHRDDDDIFVRCRDAYVNGYHEHDLLLHRMRELSRAGARQLGGHVRADEISFGPYRESIYVYHGISARLSTYLVDEAGGSILFNLYRHRAQSVFQDAEIRAFEQLSPALIQLLKGHVALRAERVPADGAEVLRGLDPDLTERELDVCRRLLQGMTHAGIAADLGVAESTVKTYRNRAFQRLGIHFRSELFALAAPRQRRPSGRRMEEPAPHGRPPLGGQPRTAHPNTIRGTRSRAT